MFRVRIVPGPRIDWAREARIVEMASQGILRLCAKQTVDSFERNTPVESSRLIRALTEVDGPHRTAAGGWVGVGDLGKLGHPSQKAPRGTIKAFLEWFRGREPHGKTGLRRRGRVALRRRRR